MSHEDTEDPLVSLPDFWDRFRNAEKIFIGLDYDGTLAPFHSERDKATPPEGVIDLLNKLKSHDGITLALISGRPISEIFDLIGDLGIPVSGSHGYEMYTPEIGLDSTNPTPIQKIGMDIAKSAAANFNFDNNVEEKIASVAVHTRALPDDQREKISTELMKEWHGIKDVYDLEIMEFDGGIELRSTGRDKGSIILRMISMNGADLNIYIGDDTTDEDVFNVLSPEDAGFKVGQPGEETMADGFIRDTDGVREFLSRCVNELDTRKK